MHRTFALLTAAALSLPTVALAQNNLVVVELFTSQGCSSCPPADELMGELAAHEDVIALSLHVDYWDYIGWEDTFAEPAFTARQHGYRIAAESTVVYTPQMIVDGERTVQGYRPMELAQLISEQAEAPDPISISVEGEGGTYLIRAAAAGGALPVLDVHIVSYSPHEQVDVLRGENAGHLTNHYNVVRSWNVVAEWDGSAPFSAQVTPQSDRPHVVLFQAQDHGAILGAARLN